MGTQFSAIAIEHNPKFVAEVLADASFTTNGYLYGDKGGIYWGAVDPVRHPLYVWQKNAALKPPGYVQTAHALNAAVFSNGPLMTIPGAQPYGAVKSVQNSINDQGARNLDKWLYGFGRKASSGAVKFTDYDVFKAQDAKGVDVPVTGYAEAIVGLYPLILKGKVCSSDPNHADYNKAFADFIKTATIAAWGLIPPKDEKQGIIVAAGRESSRIHANDIKRVVDAFVGIGVQDAVAMDGGSHVDSSSSMLGEHANSWFDPVENLVTQKQTLQKYGFYCS